MIENSSYGEETKLMECIESHRSAKKLLSDLTDMALQDLVFWRRFIESKRREPDSPSEILTNPTHAYTEINVMLTAVVPIDITPVEFISTRRKVFEIIQSINCSSIEKKLKEIEKEEPDSREVNEEVFSDPREDGGENNG